MFTLQSTITTSNQNYILYGALIGAFTAILSQLVIHYFQTKREKSKLRRELIAECVGLSHIIRGLCNEVSMYRTNKHYYKRLALIIKNEMDPNMDYVINNHEQVQKLYHERNLLAREVENKILHNAANYFKALTHLNLLQKLPNGIVGYKEFSKKFIKPEVNRFHEFNNLAELRENARVEEERIKQFYVTYYITPFEEINKLIEKFKP